MQFSAIMHDKCTAAIPVSLYNVGKASAAAQDNEDYPVHPHTHIHTHVSKITHSHLLLFPRQGEVDHHLMEGKNKVRLNKKTLKVPYYA